ncbi:hypothetical protein ACSSS7_008057 [Eimeria intestinalis]
MQQQQRQQEQQEQQQQHKQQEHRTSQYTGKKRRMSRNEQTGHCISALPTAAPSLLVNKALFTTAPQTSSSSRSNSSSSNSSKRRKGRTWFESLEGIALLEGTPRMLLLLLVRGVYAQRLGLAAAQQLPQPLHRAAQTDAPSISSLLASHMGDSSMCCSNRPGTPYGYLVKPATRETPSRDSSSTCIISSSSSNSSSSNSSSSTNSSSSSKFEAAATHSEDCRCSSCSCSIFIRSVSSTKGKRSADVAHTLSSRINSSSREETAAARVLAAAAAIAAAAAAATTAARSAAAARGRGVLPNSNEDVKDLDG